jgi:hypothetical protein
VMPSRSRAALKSFHDAPIPRLWPPMFGLATPCQQFGPQGKKNDPVGQFSLDRNLLKSYRCGVGWSDNG